MKKFSWKVVGILSLLLSTVALTMMFGGLGTTMSRLALTVIAALAIIATVMLMPKKETPATTTGAPATPAVTPAPVATPAPVTTPAPVAPADMSQEDVLNMVKLLNNYYCDKSANITNVSDYLQISNDLAVTLQKTTDLFVQAKQKQSAAERKAEQLYNMLNSTNQKTR